MEYELLKQILIEQRNAILKKNLGIKREVLQRVKDKVILPHVIVITGIRRCGKSTLLRQIINQFYSDQSFYYINFEDERLIGFKASGFNVIYEALLELFGEQKTFLIDEAQNIPGFEIFVRRFYDQGFKFYITGSNSKLLSSEIGSRLTGRHVDIYLRPFSFTEYMQFKNLVISSDDIYIAEKRAEIQRYFNEWLVNGGMPEYVIYNDQEILTRIYDDIVLKDIVARYKVEDISYLRELYRYLVSNFACKYSYNSLTKITPYTSVVTIKRFIHYMQETYFWTEISKFDFSYRKQLSNDKKLYLCDNGFIDTISTRLTKDKGWVLENTVYNSLAARYEVYYYFHKKECDFVTLDHGKLFGAYQVCAELTEQNHNRELEGLSQTMSKLGISRGFVLTFNIDQEIDYNGFKISILPVWKWLLSEYL